MFQDSTVFTDSIPANYTVEVRFPGSAAVLASFPIVASGGARVTLDIELNGFAGIYRCSYLQVSCPSSGSGCIGTNESRVFAHIENFNPTLLTGLASFAVNPNAAINTLINGTIFIDYDLYSLSPNDPNFNPGNDGVAFGQTVQLDASVLIANPVTESLESRWSLAFVDKVGSQLSRTNITLLSSRTSSRIGCYHQSNVRC